jgi:hypothetical protein
MGVDTMRIEEKVIPAQLKCDKHSAEKACTGTVLECEVFVRVRNGEDDAPIVLLQESRDLCEKARLNLVAVSSAAITPVTRRPHHEQRRAGETTC